MLQSTIHEWTHGPKALLLLYACVALPMLAVHFRVRSPFVTWLRSVWVAVPLTVVGMLIVVLAQSLLSHVGVTGENIFSGLLSLGILAILGHVYGERMANEPDSNSVYRRSAVVSARAGKGANCPLTAAIEIARIARRLSGAQSCCTEFAVAPAPKGTVGSTMTLPTRSVRS
jgi:hypothetical protein